MLIDKIKEIKNIKSVDKKIILAKRKYLVYNNKNDV